MEAISIYTEEELTAFEQRSRLPNDEVCDLVREIRRLSQSIAELNTINDTLRAQIAHAPHSAPAKAAKDDLLRAQITPTQPRKKGAKKGQAAG